MPGGGIDEEEDVRSALLPEIQEEVGCSAEIIRELGETLEFRHYEDETLEQYSYCFLAKQIGDKGEQQLEQGEIDEGHDLTVVTNINEAIVLLSKDQPKNKEGQYIRLRDLIVLKKAKELIT